MKDRIIKPRVFLSHARKNVGFIERLEIDLRKCQIESWRDQNEIRDGQPFLQAIFEEGLPTCDAILAYFTEDSVESKMVGKEVDSAILTQLADSRVAFLPYVDKDETRKLLRIDLQSLQCRTWNDENYLSILPSVVAEIWRSFLERHTERAILLEKNRRLELELELQSLRAGDSSPFSSKEESEFRFIKKRLETPINVFVTVNEKESDSTGKIVDREIKKLELRMIPLEIILDYVDMYHAEFDNSLVNRVLRSDTELYSKLLDTTDINKYNLRFDPENISPHLLTLGFVEHVRVKISSGFGSITRYKFLPKIHRFKLWSEFHNVKHEIYSVEIIEDSSREQKNFSQSS